MNKPFVVPVFIPQAGCPFRCVFCNQYIITGIQKETLRSSKIIEIINEFLKYNHTHNPNVQISFYGGNFLGLSQKEMIHLLDVGQSYVSAQKVQSLRFSTRPDTVSFNQLQRLQPYCVKTIELGVQSMNDRVLEKCHRGHTSDDTRKATRLLKKGGYTVGHQLMIGLPGDNEHSYFQTVEQIIALQPDFVRLYPTLVFKNSTLARWYQSGEYNPLTLDRAVMLAKKTLNLLSRHEIPVIRMGLQSQDRMESNILAGPYHPSFGHFVYSEQMFDRVCKEIQLLQSSQVTVLVNNRQISQLQGLQQNNIRRLNEKFPDKRIRIILDPAISDICIMDI